MNWEKASGIATVLTLISSTFLGAYGVYLGQKSISQIASIESAKLQPLIEIDHRTGTSSGIIAINLGFGPAIVDHFSITRRTGSGNLKQLIYRTSTSYSDVIEFFELEGINDQDATDSNSVLFALPYEGSVYASGEKVVIVENASISGRSPEWRSEFWPRLHNSINGLAVCIQYRAIDGTMHEKSFRDGCGDFDGEPILIQ